MKPRASRQWSQGRWAVYLFACLAMSVFITFDLLDVDGSNTRNAVSGTSIATETVGIEAERLAHLTPTPPTSASDATFPRRSSIVASILPSLSPSTITPQTRLSLGRPRGHTKDTNSSDVPDAGDPA